MTGNPCGQAIPTIFGTALQRSAEGREQLEIALDCLTDSVIPLQANAVVHGQNTTGWHDRIGSTSWALLSLAASFDNDRSTAIA